MLNNMSKTFCTEPFKQIHFDSRGNIGPCCQYVGNRDNSINSIEEYLNSSVLSNIKQSLNSGTKIDGCRFCWKQEEAGAESMRQKRNKFYANKKNELNQIEHIMITFGNQCNTACRICNASRSSLIEKQYKESAKDIEDPDLLRLITKQHDWSKSKVWYKNIIDGIIEKSHTIRKLEISGGEPFINVHYDRLIDKLNESEKDLPQISVTTNGSYSEFQIEKLKKFKHCHINFSVDGVGEKFYNYLRWPLKWEDFLTKVEILKKFEWLTCEFVIVPHNLNILNLADTIEYLKTNTSFDPRFKIGFSWLNGAPWYSLDNSPLWVRNNAIDDLKKLLNKYNFTEQEVLQIQELIYILEISNTPTDVKMFKNHVSMTDTYRKCNTYDIIGWSHEEIGK